MKTIIQTLLKSLLVGLVYVLVLALGGIIVSAVGLRLPETNDAIEKLFWSFVGGTIAGLCLGPIAAAMPATRTRHLFVWTSVLFLNLASVAIEGYIFAPEVVGDGLLGLLIQQFLASLGASWIITVLFAQIESVAIVRVENRSGLSWLWRFLTSAFMYVFFYFVFGATNYVLVTKPYYETHAGGLAVPEVTATLTTEIIRGALITLSVLPFILTMRVDRKLLAVQTGLILFSVGGLVPLTMQVGTLPVLLLVASAVEIFLQNYFTGVTVSRLMGFDNTKTQSDANLIRAESGG